MSIPNKQDYISNITKRITHDREDLSPYLVHLTRDTAHPAFSNLKSIIKQGCIEAHSCDFPFHNEFENHIKQAFSLNTCSFTDTPESQLKNLTREDLKRKKNLQPYGIALNKNTIIKANGNPVHYVYGRDLQVYYNYRIREILDELKTSGTVSGGPGGNHAFLTQVLPFIKYVTEKNNWAWEREWKVTGHFRFKEDDIVKIYVRNEIEADEIRQLLPNKKRLIVNCLDDGLSGRKEIIYELVEDRLNLAGKYSMCKLEQKVIIDGENIWEKSKILDQKLI